MKSNKEKQNEVEIIFKVLTRTGPQAIHKKITIRSFA